MSGDFESLLESLVPGASRSGMSDAESPDFPKDLGLQPLGVIGRGGVGWVYRARDPVLARDVAVKISRPDGGENARLIMLEEARTTCRLQHPAVIPVHRLLVRDGLMCIEFQLAPETTLARVLQQWRMGEREEWGLEERLHSLLTVVSAVWRAHDLAVVHGDLHPGNIALGEAGEPYVLDWSGQASRPGTFSGTAAYAAPEQLRGEGASPASDVFAMAAVGWELVTGRPMRARLPDESPGETIARWRAAEQPSFAEMDPSLGLLFAEALDDDPSIRPTAEQFWDRLGAVLTGGAERQRRETEADARIDKSHAALNRFRQLGRRLVQERQVLVVQRAKIPGWAPPDQKRSLWDAEDRVSKISDDRERALNEALALAQQATTLAPNASRANAILAELWWARLERAEERLDHAATKRAEERVREYGDGRYAHMLDSPALLDLTTDAPDATVRIHEWVEKARVLVRKEVAHLPLPLKAFELGTGSWLLEIQAPGRADVLLPLQLGRLEHRIEHVPMYTAVQIGDGWVQIPGGAFIMGGDPIARMSVPRCEPWVEQVFIRKTAITSAEWLEFLNDLPAGEAEALVPGEMGAFGGSTAFWPIVDGAYALPEGWPPTLPAIGVSLHNIEQYAAWRSTKEGRVIRLPTEEEWEKSARGVDGRTYPWGADFDPTFAHMRRSQPGPPRPHPVAGYPVDCSPYGVLDMSGGVREWTGSVFDAGQMVIRGGTFGDDADDLRVATRSGFQPQFRLSWVGFRLVAEGPAP